MDNRLSVLLPCWEGLCEQAQQLDFASRKDFDIFRTRSQTVGLPATASELSALGRRLLVAASTGRFTASEGGAGEEEGLSKPAEASVLPLFLYNAWSVVFNDDGSCRDGSWEGPTLKRWTPTPRACAAFNWLRQLTAVFSKLKLPYDESKIGEVAQRFIANEQRLRLEARRLYMPDTWAEMSPSLDGESISFGKVLLKASKLISRVLAYSEPRNIIPKHGSGASACGRKPWERYTDIRFHPDIHRIWPYHEYCTWSKSHAIDIAWEAYACGHEWFSGYPRKAKCVFVPKDYRGPRLISEEPAESMYHQQGLMSELVDTLQAHNLTKGYVNFTDQSVNQRLALAGSLGSQRDPDNSQASLDLRDASDLVSWPLVCILWPRKWLDALDAVRSRATVLSVPGKGRVVVPLLKHAPMGSAVCFPVMALTIWAIIKAATPPRTRVWVYGDDIIVNSRATERAIWALEKCLLSVNTTKSFRDASPFRESCGEEYFAGCRVTPAYLRLDPQDNMAYASSLCTFANQIGDKFGDCSALDLVKLVHDVTGAPVIPKPKGVCDSNTLDLLLLSGLNPVFTQTWRPVGFKSQPRPLLLYNEFADQVDPVGPRKRKARLPGDGSPRGWNEMRVRIPTPCYEGVNPDKDGYVLRALLIGGHLGFDARHAIANRVRYKYRWVHAGW